MNRFFRAQMRTLDVDAAERFYQRVFGRTPGEVVPLHERALARGAKPHWLGFIEVADVERSTAEFESLGATSMGPPWTNPQGLHASLMRDPGGALLALASPGRELPHGPTSPEVVFVSNNSGALDRTLAAYRSLLGWTIDAPLDTGDTGIVHPFACEPGAKQEGVFLDITGRPGVHPHWLFHFGVDSLDRSIAEVRSAGGLVLDPIQLPDGTRIAVCDDPQDAAFALQQSA